MKSITNKIIIVGLLLLTTNVTFSQTKELELSNAEKFSTKSGLLIQKEYLEIGSIKGVNIKVVHFTDLINNKKRSALKFEYESIGKYASTTKTAILDPDEIDVLIRSITIIQNKIFPKSALNYTEVSFKSRGGFEAGCFLSKDSWSTYLKLEKHDKDSYVFLEKEDFPTLLKQLEVAKSKL